MQAGVGLLDTDVMSMFMIIALDIVITLHLSINCSSIICSPTIIISILIEASSETYGPQVYFPSYKFPIYNSSFRFTFFAIFYFTFHKPKILLYRLSISIRSHVANNREGIDNPFIALGARLVFVCAGIRWLAVLSPTGLIPWFSKAEEILTLLCCITFSSSRKTNASSRRSSLWPLRTNHHARIDMGLDVVVLAESFVMSATKRHALGWTA